MHAEPRHGEVVVDLIALICGPLGLTVKLAEHPGSTKATATTVPIPAPRIVTALTDEVVAHMPQLRIRRITTPL